MYAGSSPASRIDTRRISPNNSSSKLRKGGSGGGGISSTPVMGNHYHNDYDSPISTPDLSIIDHSPSVLARSQNTRHDDHHHAYQQHYSPHQDQHHNQGGVVSSSSPSSILERLAQQGISPEERRRATVVVPPPPTTTSTSTTTSTTHHYSNLPHRPESLPKRASPPQEGHRRTVDKILSSPSSKRRATSKSASSPSTASSRVDASLSSGGDILFNPSTKMYRDTEEELRRLKEDRQKIKSMLLELELEADTPAPSPPVAAPSVPTPVSYHTSGDSQRQQSDATARTPPPPPTPPPSATRHSTSSKSASPPTAHHQTHTSRDIRVSTTRSTSSTTKSQSVTSTHNQNKKAADSSKSVVATRRTASNNNGTRRSATTSSSVATALSSGKVAGEPKGRKMWWQDELRNTPKEVVESHRSRLLGDLRKKHAERLITRDVTVSAAQAAQREERAKRRAAMGYHSDPYSTSSSHTIDDRRRHHDADGGTFGGAWSNTIEKKEGHASSYLSFLQRGSHPSLSCATPALHRYLTTTTAPTNKSHTTFTTIPATTIYDSNSGLPKQMYGAAIDVLSSNGLASERYCVASVHDRLQQLRLAVGCIIPSISKKHHPHHHQSSVRIGHHHHIGADDNEEDHLRKRATIATVGGSDIEEYLSVPFLSHQLASVASRRPGANQDQWWRLRQDHHHHHYPGDDNGDHGKREGGSDFYDGTSTQSVGGVGGPPSSVPFAPSATSFHSHYTNVTAPIARSRFAASVASNGGGGSSGRGVSKSHRPNGDGEELASTLRPSSDSPVPHPQTQSVYKGTQGSTRSRLQSAESDSPPWDRAVSGSAGSGAGAPTQPL